MYKVVLIPKKEENVCDENYKKNSLSPPDLYSEYICLYTCFLCMHICNVYYTYIHTNSKM